MENKLNEQNQVCSDEDIEIEVDKGFEAYRALLQKQREFCEKHGLKTATIVVSEEKNLKK